LFECEFCHKTFKKQATITSHTCQARDRVSVRTTRPVQLGFRAFQEFYQHSFKTTKTIEEFERSSYYSAFVNFGRFCQQVRVLDLAKFVQYNLTRRVRIDHWCNDRLYNDFVVYFVLGETAVDGLARTVDYAIGFCDANDIAVADYLRLSPNRLVQHIQSGRLSPWVIYNSDLGMTFLENINSQQQSVIWPLINPVIWERRLKLFRPDCEYIRSMTQRLGW
jgi:hypothetical protein